MIGHVDDKCVVEQARFVQLVECLDHIRIHQLLKVAVKIAASKGETEGLELRGYFLRWSKNKERT